MVFFLFGGIAYATLPGSVSSPYLLYLMHRFEVLTNTLSGEGLASGALVMMVGWWSGGYSSTSGVFPPPFYYPKYIRTRCYRPSAGLRSRSGVKLGFLFLSLSKHYCDSNDCISVARINKINSSYVVPVGRVRCLAILAKKQRESL